MGRFFQLDSSNQQYVNSFYLLEVKNEISLGYRDDIDLIGLMIIGPVEHKTNIKFKKMHDFGSYINAIDFDYDSGDGTFTGYVYKLNTPRFKVVERSAYAKGTNFLQEWLNNMDKIIIFLQAVTALQNVITILPKNIP